MTDKSFGDFYNKNHIKNPLLSSAVTGVSLDELTHKAVLLPVSPVQELSARSEQQGTQNATLLHTQHDQPNPAGDALPNIQISTQTIPSTNKNVTAIQKTVKSDNSRKTSNACQSKASVKSEDDFDVNEYIARLQGSRYVSAPLHSHLKDDNNANLSTTEENLEEINLNENQNVEAQQSLTADLAQNFSQLPTVLPHVASAVFSSFSNMLNLRSRDQTPDDRVHQELKPNYQDHGSVYQKPGHGAQEWPSQGLQERNSGVPLTVEDRPPKELAPPPREPPVMTGPSNFRLPTRKKYAQIPGLSTGEAQILPYSSQAQATSIPSFFTPGPEPVGGNETANTVIQNVNVFAPKPEVQASTIPNFFIPGSTSVGQSETTNTYNQNITNVNTFPIVNETYKPVGQTVNIPSIFTPTPLTAGANETAHIENVANVNMYYSNEPHKPVAQASSIPTSFTLGSVAISGNEITNTNAQNVTNTNVFVPNEQYKTGIEASSIPAFFTPGSTITGGNETANTSNATNVITFSSNEPYTSPVPPTVPNESNPHLFVVNKNVERNSPAAQFGDTHTPIIPPPPMFSNLRRDSQSTPAVGKTILPPSVARRISANQPLIRSQNVALPCPENIFVPDSGPIKIDNLSQSQSTVFQSQESIPQRDTSRAIKDQTLPQITSSTALPSFTNAPPTGPAFFNPSNIRSKDPFIPTSIQAHQSDRPTASSLQSSTASSIQHSFSHQSQSVQKPDQSIQSFTSEPQILNPYTQTSESQSVGVPMFLTPSEIPSVSKGLAELSAKPPPMPPSEPSIFTPSVPASPQSSNLFSPDMVLPTTVPTQLSNSVYPPQNKPPIPLIEPPKATGPVSFRMTKKRPQYYSGPIEGIGSISNQVKPTIPTAVPTIETIALFTPETVHLETPSHPEGFSVAQIAPSYDQPQEVYNAPFDLSQPQQGPEYNNAFDLSRPTTEAYDQPKPEPKGFGLIGSLKSKLSSIDINKIQNTVTTFFDPAYKDTEKVETSLQENHPYELGQHTQVIEPFIYSGAYDNNHIPQNLKQSYEQIQVTNYYYNNPNYSQGNTADSQYTNYAQNIPFIQHVRNIPFNTAFQGKYTEGVKNEVYRLHTNVNTEISRNIEDNKSENILLPQPDVITTLDQHLRDDPTNKIEIIHSQVTQEHNYYNQATTNLFGTSQQDTSDTSFHGDNSNQFGHVGSVIPQKPPVYVNYPQSNIIFEARDVNPDIIEDTLRQFPTTVQTQTLIFTPSNVSGFFDSNIENDIKIDEVPTLATLGVPLTDDETEPTQDIPSNYLNQPNNQRNEVFSIEANLLADDLLANLTVGEDAREAAVEIRPTPSSAPRCGISAITTDRSKEFEEVRPFNNARRHSMLGSNSSASFFENIPTNDDVIGKVDLKGLSITDVRNVLLIEPPQEHICAVLKRNASSNLNSSTPEVSKDNYLLDPPGNSFFDHTLRDEVEQDDSELNICETCREVNTPDPKKENVTAQLIDNITSRIQLSNVIEFPYIDNIPPNLPIRETAIDDQLEEIRNITEDTIETLQAQAAIERLDESPNSEYAAYSTAIQSCKYAFEDPEPIIKPSLNFKLDPDTEASLSNYSAYYDSSTLFYHNRLPENASDETKANYQASSQEESEDDNSDDKSDEAGLDVHLIEQDASHDFPIDEEFIIEPSDTDEDKIEIREILRTPETSDTFTNRVERFQKAVDAGECFNFNSPTSLASYFDTGNYAVEAHYRNLQHSPDLVNLRFPPGFEDEYDRRMSGYNGSPLAPQIPDCGCQTSIINTCTYSKAGRSTNTSTYTKAGRRYRNLQRYPILLKAESDKIDTTTQDPSEDIFRDPETAQLFKPTAPELSVIEAKTPDLGTIDGDSSQTATVKVSEPSQPANKYEQTLPTTTEIYKFQEDNSQETEKPEVIPINLIEPQSQEISVTKEFISEENVTELYSTLSQLTTNTKESETPNLFEEKVAASNFFEAQTIAPNLNIQETSTPHSFEPQTTNEMEIKETETSKESDLKSQLTINTEPKEADFFKPQELDTTKIIKQESPEISKDFQTEEPKGTTELFPPTVSNIFDSKPVESNEEPTKNFFDIKPTNVIDNAETINLEKQLQNTNLTKAMLPENINITSHDSTQALPDPVNFFSSKDESPITETSGFNRLASYFATSPSKPDHSKSFFELSQSQNHYRHSTANNAQNETKLDQNARQNLTNLMRDLTSTKNIPNQENIVRSINYFTVEYDLKNLKELVNNTEIGQSNLFTNKVDNLNLNTDTEQLHLDHKIEKNNVNPTESSSDETLIEITINCQNCNIHTKEFNVRKCANDTEPSKNSVLSDMEERSSKKSVPNETDSMMKHGETEDGVTVIVEAKTPEYTPVRHHWFYRFDVDDKSVWRGFSVLDSNALEEAFLSSDLNENTVVATDGGRFDVNVVGRLRVAVYWKEKPTNVRRCSWFYKGTTDARYVPYTETVAEKLEDEYRHGITTGEWHRRLVLPNNEVVIMHGPTVMVHFWQGNTDAFSTPAITLLGKRVYRNPPKIRVVKDEPQIIDHLVFFVHGAGEYKKDMDDTTSRPRVVRRGHEESEIEEASPTGMDHLLLLCHGVGSACDMRFRSVEEVVEDFRATSLQLVQSHYKNSFDDGLVNRVEVLPISWHSQLHGGEAGVDRRLQRITLESIPRLRAFTNHTVLDVLFYTSPVYHQTIIDTVCFELNRIYNLFKQRNPNFKGGVSLGGHSLGSVILYDLLCNQVLNQPLGPKSSAEKTYLPDITSSEPIKYPVLQFKPDALYALGSPIAIFECIRGVETLGLEFSLPTCKNFFNIFHPYDPIAYRIEPLINPELQNSKPFLIPHHKGRKRMHLELKDTMVRVGSDLKQKLLESLRTTWNKWKATPPTDGQLEKVVEEEMEKEQLCEDKEEQQENIEMSNPDLLGHLNAGRRIDYVLQEAPLEMINEYLFAMSSHVGYWESEDTMLLMLREIYSSLGVQPDSTVPQQSMTVHRTRTPKMDETVIVNEKDCPSTSRGGVA